MKILSNSKAQAVVVGGDFSIAAFMDTLEPWLQFVAALGGTMLTLAMLYKVFLEIREIKKRKNKNGDT